MIALFSFFQLTKLDSPRSPSLEGEKQLAVEATNRLVAENKVNTILLYFIPHRARFLLCIFISALPQVFLKKDTKEWQIGNKMTSCDRLLQD